MTSDQEMEEQLRRQAERVIRRVLEEKKPAGKNSLKDIEQMAIRAGEGFREEVLAYLAREESQAKEEPVCDECRRRMKSRGKRKRAVVIEAGEVSVEYVCPGCGKKIFPPG
jgi:predicted RNA-binding Zn-ribbon protein involved in translation (DUF1610 family)